MSDTGIDYAAVDVPPEKDPEDYTYAERRSEVLEHVRAKGHPQLVNGAELGRKYGVTRQTIYNDMDVLAESIESTISKRHVLATDTVLRRATAELIEQEEWAAAARVSIDHSEWIRETVELENLREQVAGVVKAQEQARHR